jgi:Ca-activated chloride channel family protein
VNCHVSVKSGGAVAILAAALWVGTLAAQSTPAVQDTVYRSRSDLVSLFATVTTADDTLVMDLPQDAFQVYDNGHRQTVTVFSRDVQPISVIVLLDRSGSMAADADLVSDAAAEFVKRLLPTDKARIGHFSNEIVMAPDTFTSDQAELLRVLAGAMQPAESSPIWTATDRAVTALLHEGGRRVILLLTDGHDNPMRGQVHTDVKDVIYRAEYDEIMLYTIGVSNTEWQLTGGGPRGSRFGGPPRPQGGAYFSSKTEPPDPSLKKLADESGGRYFYLDPEQHLASLFARIADELHHQYWLGFVPAKLDGDVHKLEVKIARQGLTVRARRSYVADSRMMTVK